MLHISLFGMSSRSFFFSYLIFLLLFFKEIRDSTKTLDYEKSDLTEKFHNGSFFRITNIYHQNQIPFIDKTKENRLDYPWTTQV